MCAPAKDVLDLQIYDGETAQAVEEGISVQFKV